jgi:hypothetical protein
MIANRPKSPLKIIKKTIAGILMVSGIPVVLWSAFHLGGVSAWERELALILLTLVGLPPTAIGSWLLWTVAQQSKQEQLEAQRDRAERLQSTFFRMIVEGDGAITPLEFSMATQLSGQEAKVFLDGCAKDYDGAFDVTYEGNIIYRFDVQRKQLGQHDG